MESRENKQTSKRKRSWKKDTKKAQEKTRLSMPSIAEEHQEIAFQILLEQKQFEDIAIKEKQQEEIAELNVEPNLVLHW
jgi:hypothetical protein